jgi:N-acetylmuramoyl-L-alanine amidase
MIAFAQACMNRNKVVGQKAPHCRSKSMSKPVPAIARRAMRAIQRATCLALALVALMQGPGLSAAMAAPGAPPNPPPGGAISIIAFDSRIEGDQNLTTITIDLSQPVDAKSFVLDQPDRLVIDLPAINFQLAPEAGRKAVGLVKAWRFGLFAAGRSRLVIDLAQPATASRIRTDIVPGPATRLTIELKRTDRAQFTRLARGATEALTAPVASAASANGTTTPRAGDVRPIVVLDPGHGGPDVGATGIGNTYEKDVVFGFAKELKAKLERSGRIRVVLTRDADMFVALGERVRMARSINAALFVSIHADTIAAAPDVRGMTVYTGSEKATDAEAARLAEAENRADAVAGVEELERREEVADILDDLTKRETRVYSNLFARTLVAQMGAAGGKLNKNPHRSAGFRVLRAPDVPSVLLELGYLSSKSDVELMTTADWRDKATEQLSGAIMEFMAPRLAQTPVSLRP